MGLFRDDLPQQKDIESQPLFKSIRNKTNPKKPVKYKFKSLAELIANLHPMNVQHQVRRLEELKEKKVQEKDYIDFFEDVEKGLYGIPENILYSIGDLATIGIDAARGTDLNEKLDKHFEENKLDDPETLTAKAVELVGTYGFPGTAVFKIAS